MKGKGWLVVGFFFFLFKKGDTAAMVLIGRNMDWKGAGRLGIMFC